MGGQLKKYTVTLHGTRTVMKLNAADAERLGGVPLDGPEPEAGPETPPAGETTSEPFVEVPESKRRPTAANKARAAATNKGGEGVDD